MRICGFGAALDLDALRQFWLSFDRLRHQPGLQRLRFGDRRRQADSLQGRAVFSEPRQPQREQMAALRRDQRMQLVENDKAQIGEQRFSLATGDQQGNLFRRRQQNNPAGSRFCRCRLCCGVSPVRVSMRNGSCHFLDRLCQIAFDIDSQRLQWRNIERVNATPRQRPCSNRALRFALSCVRSTSDGRKPASVLPAPVGAISRQESPDCAMSSSSSWCGRGCQPRLPNQPVKGFRQFGHHFCFRIDAHPAQVRPRLCRKKCLFGWGGTTKRAITRQANAPDWRR